MPRGTLSHQKPPRPSRAALLLANLRAGRAIPTVPAQDLDPLALDLQGLAAAGAPPELLAGLTALHPPDHFGAEEGHPCPGGFGA